jgi:hypothetical protein
MEFVMMRAFAVAAHAGKHPHFITTLVTYLKLEYYTPGKQGWGGRKGAAATAAADAGPARSYQQVPHIVYAFIDHLAPVMHDGSCGPYASVSTV